MGTVGYMSPEQARAADVDVRTDIWSLGVVMYEMVSGRRAFVGETPSQTIVSIIEHEPVPLSINSEVPRDLQRIITKCLVKNRDQRYQKVGDLLSDLKRLKQRLEVDAAIGGAAQPAKTGDDAVTEIHKPMATDDIVVEQTGSRGLKSSRRRQLLMGSVLVFVALTTSVAYWRYKSTNRPIAVPSTNQSANTASPIRSLAVMPFENYTENRDWDYLSTAIPETIGTQLSKMPGAKVTIRSSPFRVNGKVLDFSPTETQEYANRLGVGYILIGQIIQRGNKTVLSVQLIDLETSLIWDKEYDRKLTDVLAVQLEISNEIVQQLRDLAFTQFVIVLKH